MTEDNDKYSRIGPYHPALQYTGRNDLSEPEGALLLYAGNMIRTRFSGTSLQVRMSMFCDGSHPLWIGVMIDGGEMISIPLVAGDEARTYAVASGIEEAEHEMILIRKSDFVAGNCRFHGLLLDAGAEALCSGPRPDRRMECFGDSITAGGQSDAAGYEGREDPVDEDGALSNPWHTYGSILARLAGAELHNNGLGGLALKDGYGYTCLPNTIGLESTFDKLNPIPEQGGITTWDFSLYEPQIVIIAIGQNDSSTYPDPAANPEAGEAWIQTYLLLLKRLRGVYPNAYLLLTTTLMRHPAVWDDLLFSIAGRADDPRVTAYRYQRAGIASPGHLRRAEAEEMAVELAAFIETLNDPWQEAGASAHPH